jgi:hypothetical protein
MSLEEAIATAKQIHERRQAGGYPCRCLGSGGTERDLRMGRLKIVKEMQERLWRSFFAEDSG